MARVCRSTKSTEFRFYAPQAKRVSLAGNFNNWNSRTLTAKKDSQGNWLVKMNLKPGRYEYKFIVDGNWTNDPRCSWCIPNNLGTQNCVVEVK